MADIDQISLTDLENMSPEELMEAIDSGMEFTNEPGPQLLFRNERRPSFPQKNYLSRLGIQGRHQLQGKKKSTS